MVTRVLKEEDRQHLALLRELGLDEQARRYEELLRGNGSVVRPPRPRPAPPVGAVSIAEAGALLGLPRKEVRRDLELGLLKSEIEPTTGETLVTKASIARRLEFQRALAIIALPLPGDSDERPHPDSLLGRMFAEANEPYPDDEEE
jgi:hypothetical protein